jgi:hypothetical protein
MNFFKISDIKTLSSLGMDELIGCKQNNCVFHGSLNVLSDNNNDVATEFTLENIDNALESIQNNELSGKSLIMCGCCFAGFLRKNKLLEHIKSKHFPIEPVQCNLCNCEMFVYKQSLEKHKDIIHGYKMIRRGLSKRQKIEIINKK